MRKINILHIITKLELGGAQKSTLYTVEHLDKDKYNVYLVSSRGILVEEALKIPNIKVILFPSLRRELNPFCDLWTITRLFFCLKKINPDIVHTHSSKAGVLGRWTAKLAGTRCIIHTIHGWEFHNFQIKFIRWFYIFLERITAKITDKLIVVSRNDIEKGLNVKIGVREKYTLIRYGIQIQDFIGSKLDSQRKKEELGLNSNSPVVGMVACFKPQKSPQDFIKAAYRITRTFPQTKFLLVGDGILRRHIERLIDKLRLRESIILTGWRRDIPQIVSTLDIFVLSSLWEGLPIVFLEAMACQKPIVATDTSGAREVIKDGENGFLVFPGDFEELAGKIILLLKDRDLSRTMGEKGYKFLLNNSFEAGDMVNRIERIYDDLIGEKDRC